MLRLAASFAFLLACVGCEPWPEGTPASVKHGVKLLFVHDGCAVYSFSDSGREMYFTRCDRAVHSSATRPRHHAGKHTVPEQDVQTAYPDGGP